MTKCDEGGGTAEQNKMEEKLPFRSAKLKIKRAHHHIIELTRLMNTLAQPEHYIMDIQEDLETAKPLFVVRINPEDFTQISLVIGDVVHNLRAALDHLVYELFTRSGKPTTRHTRFTFWKTRKEAVASIDRVIKGVSLDVITTLLEIVQPYPGGNDPLCALHALDIADKHRLIVPFLSIATGTLTHHREGATPIAYNFTITRREKTSVIHIPPEAKTKVYEYPTIEVFFDNIEGFEGFKGQPVIPTLHHLRQIVARVVEEVEQAFFAGKRTSPSR